jgi:hypothetical protein
MTAPDKLANAIEINRHFNWSVDKNFKLMHRYNRGRDSDLYVSKHFNKFLFGEPVEKPLIIPQGFNFQEIQKDLKPGLLIPINVRYEKNKDKKDFIAKDDDDENISKENSQIIALRGYNNLLNFLKENGEN